MEEVFLLIIGRDEAEAALGDDSLDSSGGHFDLQRFPNDGLVSATVRSRGRPRGVATHCGDVSP